MTDAMPSFSSGVSTLAETRSAVREACALAKDASASVPDLVLAFFSIEHSASEIAEILGREFPGSVRLGAPGEAIVAGARELERGPAISIWTAQLPRTTIVPFHLTYSSEIDQGSFLGWTRELLEPWPARSHVVLLGEPFTFPADRLAALLNQEQPGATLLGGMASGGDRPDSHPLILGDEVFSEGAVGIRIHGELAITTVVSQGCRPVGQPMVITRADRNVILEVGGVSALEQLQETYQQLTPDDQARARRGFHVGRVINEYQDRFGHGDFLIRNVLGVDDKTGAIAIGDFVRPGQTVQFHLRDAESADDDLRRQLQALGPPAPSRSTGALLFTCTGRGSRLFGTSDHDARLICETLGHTTLAGFFAAGELGPVGGKNFLHGFTASLAVFGRPLESDGA